jgi:hypothetical protein
VNKRGLLSMTAMTPAERVMGRFMRAPDHPLSGETDDGDSSSDGNNNGNSADSVNDKSGEDNNGQPPSLDRFWEAKPAEPKPEDSERNKQESTQIGQRLANLASEFKGPEVFTKEIADKIADGDLAGVNEAMKQRDTALLNHAVVMSAQLVGALFDKMSADFDARIQNAFGNKDSEITLETHFPLAKDKAMRPMVERVWQQALVNANGNKEEAIRQTRGMLEAFGSKTSIREAPEDPTAGIGTPAAKSLVASLLERDGN